MSQLHAALLCALLGLFGGGLYDLLIALSTPLRARTVAEILFCAIFAAIYLLFSVKTGLPPLRGYLVAALCLGFVLYLKSWHKIVAIPAKKVYNKLARNIRKRKGSWRKKKNFRKKRSAASQ